MEWRDLKDQLLKDEDVKKAYEATDLKYEIGKMITDARIARKMTQQRLALLLDTKQPSIARLESGSTLPSLSFLERVAHAFGTRLIPPRFEFLEKPNIRIVPTSVTVIIHGSMARNDVPNYSWAVGPNNNISANKLIEGVV